MKTDKVGKRTAVFQVSRVSEKRWFSFFFFLVRESECLRCAELVGCSCTWIGLRARVCVCLRGAKGVLRAVVVVGDECGVKGVLS